MKSEIVRKHAFVKFAILLISFFLAGSFFYFEANLLKSKIPDTNDAKTETNFNDKKLVSNENSSEVKKDFDSSISILFVGDIMLDRYIRQVGQKRGYDYIFQEIGSFLTDSDLVVGNLEGPITNNKNSVSVNSEFGSKENYVFTFDPQTAFVLKRYGVKLVNLGNNHILDFGTDGLIQTRKYLEEANIGYFCDPYNLESRVANYTLSKIKIAFVCYNQFEKEPLEKAKRDIKLAAEESDVVILYAHWDKEYETETQRKNKEIARQFVDGGVDLIIGSHPHVVQKKEEYKGKLIYYSLGNFIFDQYFDLHTTEGLAVRAVISKTGEIKTQEFILKLKNDGRTELKK